MHLNVSTRLKFFLWAGLIFTSPKTLRAAEITDVADAADSIKIGDSSKDDFFDLYLGVSYDLSLANGKISREPIDQPGRQNGGCSETNSLDCLPVDELRWKRTSQITRINSQIGIFHDLALTVDWSYIVEDSFAFRYAKGVDANTSTVDPGTDQRLFDAKFSSKHTGSGPLDLGLRFAPLNDERDDTKPAWVLFFKWSTPWTMKTYNPQNRATRSAPGAVGDGVHRLIFGTALSKRIGNFGLIGIDPNVNRYGYIEPYMELSYSYPIPEDGKALPDLIQKSGNPFGRRPSQRGEIKAGAEIIPIEDLSRGTKFSIDFGMRAAYVSEGRNYSELTDPLKELTVTEQYLQVGSLIGLNVRFADIIRLRTGFNFSYVTPHFLTNEDVGVDKNQDNQVLDPSVDQNAVKDELNPYFCGNTASDLCNEKGVASYDQQGFRFKDSDHFILNWFFTLMMTF